MVLIFRDKKKYFVEFLAVLCLVVAVSANSFLFLLFTKCPNFEFRKNSLMEAFFFKKIMILILESVKE